MKVDQGVWIQKKKQAWKKLLSVLMEKYPYASILAEETEGKRYSVSESGESIQDTRFLTNRGFVVRIHDGTGFLEYASNDFDEKEIPEFLRQLQDMHSHGKDPVPEEKEIRFEKSTSFQKDPRLYGENEVLKKLQGLRKKEMAFHQQILDCRISCEYKVSHKFYLSSRKEMEQNLLWTDSFFGVSVSDGAQIRQLYNGISGIGGMEVLASLEKKLHATVCDTLLLRGAGNIRPGVYSCICSPQVCGILAHESFGHGVEMDMFVKKRAMAAGYLGKQVASEKVSMHDSGLYPDTGMYFFDDEGNLARDTAVIERGMLKHGLCDSLSAVRLGESPTGNGRRENYGHKAYARMTNTWFEKGSDRLEDMIASVQEGFLLDYPSSGMEDPKNWGIQCIVSYAREIRDGKLTGTVYSPCVLTGFVPELLKSVDMVSDSMEFMGCNGCGKGFKEMVKVSIGGPWMKARIRLG